MSDTDRELTCLARQGDAGAFQALLQRCRPRLVRLVTKRIDRRLRARVDPSDVVQDTLTQAVLHHQQFLGDGQSSFFAWLRGIAVHRLVDLQRRHIGAERRSMLREIPFLPRSDESNFVLAQVFADSASSPERRLERDEEVARLQQAPHPRPRAAGHASPKADDHGANCLGPPDFSHECLHATSASTSAAPTSTVPVRPIVGILS